MHFFPFISPDINPPSRKGKDTDTPTSGSGIKKWALPDNTVPNNQHQTSLQFTCLQEKLAAYSTERNKLHHRYCREIPKCSQGSTQDNQGKTLPLLSSLLHILPSVGPTDLMPRKGRSEGDARTKMIASSCCISNTKPLKEQNLFTCI